VPEPDWNNPEIEAAWFAEQRALAEQYLRGQQALFGSIEPEPAWSVPPYVAFWRALGGRSGQPVYWVITGDLPTDFLPSDAAPTPRAAASAFAERWRTVAGYLSEGKEHPTIRVGAPQDRAGLAPMLRRRADTLHGWAAKDEYW
jgi:hypothetical protein